MGEILGMQFNGKRAEVVKEIVDLELKDLERIEGGKKAGMTAHRAFQFCKQYKRTTEFRRLCEIIRNHLANLNKYRDQRDRPDLSAPESLQLYLDTRFEQLKIATELELWQVCVFGYA
ncbi:Eukaryotic translation initiation factor 3 subunit A [Camellia lanceoleosa]|uniref:Eukaryotic translation initiation factor 3 subunit A n=1 Tax=Camellia lanceoleosa TaxID=1840588 RepID=A0ACC0HQN4_9ERIC|nr:Eukaryotic translation initiation factor 3 subunit A [Camellia lanceoleosa]